MRILDHLNMYTLDYTPSDEDLVALGPPNTILCSKGFWVNIYFFLKKKSIHIAKENNNSLIDLY
jgi:hypothetical protein